MRFKMLLVAILTVCFAICITPKKLNAQQTMNNDAVIKLVKAGLSDDLIVSTINSQPGTYDTSTDGLIALKKAGVSDKVVDAIVTKGLAPAAAPTATATASSLPQGVDEIGVYYKSKTGAWVEFDPEVVTFKTGGFLKSLATDGIVKGDMNGHVPGKESKLAITRPVDVLIYAPDGTSPDEYMLLKMRINSNNREFRSMTGGVFHASTGAQRDNVAFTATKIGTRLYEFTMGPETAPGEYGILPPGAISTSNAASAGKLFTFHITE